MGRHEVRATGRGIRRGTSVWSDGYPACRPLRSSPIFFLDSGMPPMPNACSGEPGEVPDDEVNAHLRNPG
jgi:hypothetical protein